MKKIVLGVSAVALALVLGVSVVSAQTAVTTTTTTSTAAFTRDLTIGSTGADVTALQAILIANGKLMIAAPTGYFGTMTKAALASWQASVGITPAVGYFGPITKAYLATHSTGSTSTSTSGCPAGAIFHPITGVRCSATTTTTTTTSTLSGGAGDITVTERSSGVEDEVNEGEEEVQVLGFEIEAEGSDIEVTSVKVEFEFDGTTGSDRLDRYVDEVFVMLGDEVVGSAEVDDFNESSDVYSQSISLDGVMIDEDEEKRLYVAVTATNNIDSTDLSKDWEVALDQVRFEDATGAILTDNTGTGVNGSISETFTFESLSSSGDIELNVVEGDESINESPTISVDDSSDTNDVEVLSFNLEAEGSDITLNTLVIDVTSSGAGVTEIANDFRLMMGDEEVGTVTIDKDCDGGSDGFASSSDAAICVVVSDIDEDDVLIDAEGEEEFTLVADINDTEGGFTSGDTLAANIAGQVIASNADGLDADDENGDALTNSEFGGSADSTSVKFISTGVTVEMTGDGTAVEVLNVDTTSTDDQGKFIVDLVITAVEDDAYIALTAASSTSADTDNVGVAFYIENASTGSQIGTGTTSSATLVKVSGGTVSSNYLRVNRGQSATVRLTAYYDALTTGSYRLQVDSVGFNATANTAANSEFETLPADDFESDSVQVLN